MRYRSFILGACLALAACDDSTGPAGDSTLVVTVTTVGGDPDLDGYRLAVDGRVSVLVGAAGTQELTLVAGRHRIELSDVAANCAVQGEASREVTLPHGETVAVQFAVTCDATGVTVRTATTGLDFDPNGYRIVLDGGTNHRVGANASVMLSRLAPGEHVLQITDIAPTCELDGPASRTVTVVNAELALVEFPLTCRAAWAAIRVEATTTGPDADGAYLASVVANPGLSALVGAGGGVILNVPAGTHQVRLDDVAANCSVSGGSTREATVTVGGAVRDTATVVFTVGCISNHGTIRVTVATSGSDSPGPHSVYLWDYDCYYCSAVGLAETDASGAGTVEFTPLSGNYTVTIQPAQECGASGSNSSGVLAVAAGAVVEAEFQVKCGAPSVQVSVTTTGSAPDTEYQAQLWYSDFYWWYDYVVDAGSLAANGTVTLEPGFAGYFFVTLSDVAANCAVTSRVPDSFHLDFSETQAVAFTVTCGP